MRRNDILFVVMLVSLIALALIVGARAGLAAMQTRVHMQETAMAETPDPTPTPTMGPLDVVWPTPTPTPEPTPTPVLTPVEEMPIVEQPDTGARYNALLLRTEEIETLARLVYLEARGECFEGQQAVAEVVLNRVLSPGFPDNVYDVIYQSGQFTPAGSIPYVRPSQTQYDAISCALSGPNVLPQQVLYFAVGQNGRTNVWGWIGNHCFCY